MISLRSRRLWRVVNGTETAPDETIDPDAHDEWYLKDQDAQLTIISALKNIGQQCIYPCQTAKESWDTLRARYSDGGNRRLASLLEQVLKATFTDSEPLQPQLDKVIFANHQLEAANVIIPDIVIAHYIALHLPDSYSTLRTVLTSSDSTKMTSKWVIDQVVAEEHHRITKFDGNANAYFAKVNKNKSRANDSRSSYDPGKKCSYCDRKGHDASECRKKQREENNQNSTSNTSGTTNSTAPPGSTTTKANVAIVEDDLIVLIDPAEDTRIRGAFMAIAQDDAIWFQKPSPQSDHSDLTSDEGTTLNNVYRALTAPAHIESIDLTTSTQSRNIEQALADSLQQTSQLNQVLKDFMDQAVTQIVRRTIDLHSRGKGEQIASEPRNAFDGIPARSARQRKVHKHQRTVPKAGYRKGRRLGQSTRNVTLDEGAPTHTHTIQLDALSSAPSQIASHLAYNAHAAAHDGNDARHVVSPDGLQLRTAGHTCVTHADGTSPKDNTRIVADNFAQIEAAPHARRPV